MEKRLRNIYKIHNKPELQKKADHLRSELFKIELQIAQGAKVRSRLRLELEGERCTKFFFQQVEKHKNSKQDMLSINRIKDGKLLTDQKEILSEVLNFYFNLYAENSCGRISTNLQKTNKQDEMLQKISKTVSRENKDYCEQPFQQK